MQDIKVLLFGTCFVDSPDRVRLTKQWAELMLRLNSDCQILLVDSQSPMRPVLDERIKIFEFPDNIGHLSRANVTPGKDGWGRAFCKGLEIAVKSEFDYVVHIEGDSLFRLPVLPICKQMRFEKTRVASIPVTSGPRGVLQRWVETGLMFFDTSFIKDVDFISRYDWPNRKRIPTPEVIVNNLVYGELKLMPWKGIRQDKDPRVSQHNIAGGNFDWITHFHNDIYAYDRFLETIA